MEYNSETPFSRKIKLDAVKVSPVPPTPVADYSLLRPVPLWLKRDYSHIDAVLAPEPAHEELSTSYIDQSLRFQLDGIEYLIANSECDLRDWPEPLKTEDENRRRVLQRVHGFWLSAWHPNGYPTPIKLLGERDEALQAAVEWLRMFTPDLRAIPATAVQARGSWVEGGAILTGITEAAAIEVARRLGQLAVVEIGTEYLKVVPVDESIRPSADKFQLIELPSAPCPMVRGCETKLPCKRYGGPFGGRAIAASGYWSRQRAVGISRMGCTLCEAGKSLFPHASLETTVTTANASRHGTASRIDLETAVRVSAAATISPSEKATDDDQ